MPPVSPEEFERLSAYLDEELSSAERALVEQQLAEDSNLQAELESLRATVALLHTAPTLQPPRDFRLDPAQFGRKVRWWANARLFQFAGAIGTAAALFLIFLGTRWLTQPASAPNDAIFTGQVALQSTQTVTATSAPSLSKMAADGQLSTPNSNMLTAPAPVVPPAATLGSAEEQDVPASPTIQVLERNAQPTASTLPPITSNNMDSMAGYASTEPASESAAAAAAAILVTSSPTPTSTAILTATATSTASSTFTQTSAPTLIPTPMAAVAQPAMQGGTVIIAIGIALLVLSLMLGALGVLRARIQD